MAHLPYHKTLEQFDFDFQTGIDERQIRELQSPTRQSRYGDGATLRFVAEAHNVIFLGPPGVGKTHLAVALAMEAIEGGYSAYFATAHDLVHDLSRATRENRLDRRLRVYLGPKLLIIDEVGYLPLDDAGATILFQLVSARYERGSIILTKQQELRRLGDGVRRPHHRQRHLGALLPAGANSRDAEDRRCLWRPDTWGCTGQKRQRAGL